MPLVCNFSSSSFTFPFSLSIFCCLPLQPFSVFKTWSMLKFYPIYLSITRIALLSSVFKFWLFSLNSITFFSFSWQLPHFSPVFTKDFYSACFPFYFDDFLVSSLVFINSFNWFYKLFLLHILITTLSSLSHKLYLMPYIWTPIPLSFDLSSPVPPTYLIYLLQSVHSYPTWSFVGLIGRLILFGGVSVGKDFQSFGYAKGLNRSHRFRRRRGFEWAFWIETWWRVVLEDIGKMIHVDYSSSEESSFICAILTIDYSYYSLVVIKLNKYYKRNTWYYLETNTDFSKFKMKMIRGNKTFLWVRFHSDFVSNLVWTTNRIKYKSNESDNFIRYKINKYIKKKWRLRILIWLTNQKNITTSWSKPTKKIPLIQGGPKSKSKGRISPADPIMLPSSSTPNSTSMEGMMQIRESFLISTWSIWPKIPKFSNGRKSIT